ncbi:hypothetical protein VTO73DRAFT_13949 [Trametes versicolor]
MARKTRILVSQQRYRIESRISPANDVWAPPDVLNRRQSRPTGARPSWNTRCVSSEPCTTHRQPAATRDSAGPAVTTGLADKSGPRRAETCHVFTSTLVDAIRAQRGTAAPRDLDRGSHRHEHDDLQLRYGIRPAPLIPHLHRVHPVPSRAPGSRPRISSARSDASPAGNAQRRLPVVSHTCELDDKADDSHGAQGNLACRRGLQSMSVEPSSHRHPLATSTVDTTRLEQEASQLRDSCETDRYNTLTCACGAEDELTAVGGAFHPHVRGDSADNAGLVDNGGRERPHEGGRKRGTGGWLHPETSASPAPPSRTLARSRPSTLGYGCVVTHTPERELWPARRMPAGHAATLTTECAPFGRVSRLRRGASSRIERHRAPRSGRAPGKWPARRWQDSGRVRATCVRVPPGARVLETARYAARARPLDIPLRAAPRQDHQILELRPYFACGGLGAHKYRTGTPPLTFRVHTRTVVPGTPYFVHGRAHAPGRREIRPPRRADPGQVRDTPNIRKKHS